MQKGSADEDRVARRVARDHGGPPRFEPPGSGRAWERRRQARAARRALRALDFDLDLDLTERVDE